MIVGLGNKARQGKDTCATFIANAACLLGIEVKIVHFNDALYKECSNFSNVHPLIIRYNGLVGLLTDEKTGSYVHFKDADFPEVFDFLDSRKIDTYRQMVSKDPQVLQLWGTDFRRKRCNTNYWVDRLTDSLPESFKGLILVPDTRFRNEYDKIKGCGGHYIRVVRLDGLHQYIDPDRDPSHISEIELDGCLADLEIVAQSGDLISLKSDCSIYFNKYLKREITRYNTQHYQYNTLSSL